ncbi:unnamed protein product [Sphenostylis stenocarpa]|uniref:PGG domain-containing protein n=1 Tax=Sphenostylis stenocarpa TaxID=92480 RepID=A0AA86SKK2_9FABA|nr:unnamed protein product [Sphenostylis stenocarpa]
MRDSLDLDMKLQERRERGLSENKQYQELLLVDELRRQSPLVAAILKQDEDILKEIVKVKRWIHLKDNKGRNALHYAAAIGYLHGVECLLQNCDSCDMEKDNDGLFPLHLASAGGHVKVIKKLLEKCLDPREIVDKYGRNIVHIAAQMGQYNVIDYILKDANGVLDLINDKDKDGNTPLHLAASHCHPKIVQALTWDKRVALDLLNKINQSALDAFEQFQQVNPSFPEALAFAAGFTLPGGSNGSTPGQGMAVMLHHAWFKPFIFCITTSMYGGISVTIILIWAQLGDLTLAVFALKVARPLLGVSIATLSVAFMAGVHLVISDLSWLATTILILCVISDALYTEVSALCFIFFFILFEMET